MFFQSMQRTAKSTGFGFYHRSLTVACLLSCGYLFMPLATPVHGQEETVSTWGYLEFRSSGGRLYGRLLDKNYKDPTSGEACYVIETESGGKIQMERAVTTWHPDSPLRSDYEAKVQGLADTPEAHLEVVNWCLEQKGGRAHLREQIVLHLLRIAELAPDDESIDRQLQREGWMKVNGRWHPEEQFYLANGYVRSGSRWVPSLQSQVSGLEAEREQKMGERRSAIAKWKRLLPRKSLAESAVELRAITDEASIPLIDEQAKEESNPELRRIMLEAIGSVPCGSAQNAILRFLMEDSDPGIRDRALSLLLQPDFDQRPDCNRAIAAQKLLQTLGHPDNGVLQWGAYCLGELGQKNVILPLVNAVQTTHKFKNPNASDPGRMNIVNSNQGTSFNPGAGGPPEIVRTIVNPSVINALKKLTGADAGASAASWQQWYLNNYTLADSYIYRDE